MIEVSKIQTMGWSGAIRGMRNSFASWDKSDTNLELIDFVKRKVVGYEDLKLMRKLAARSSDERKFLRDIHVQMDINAPLYWWKQFDTYKVSTTSLSTSTMHSIMRKPFTEEDFSWEHIIFSRDSLNASRLKELNALRELYMKTKEPDVKKDIWYQLIQTLPSSYNQLRTEDFNYENVKNFYRGREGHKLEEWKIFREILKNKLPYPELFM